MASFKNYRRTIYLDFNYDQVKKGVPEANKQMALLNAEFRKQAAEAELSGNAIDKLGVKQEAYANRIQIQRDKVATLRQELNSLEGAENRNEKAITRKTIELKNAETQLLRYEKTLSDTNQQMSNQNLAIDKVNDKLSTLDSKVQVVDAQYKRAKEGAKGFETQNQSLSREQQQLTEKINLQSEKVSLLRQKYIETSKTYGENAEATRRVRVEQLEAQTQMIQLRRSLDEVNDRLNNQNNIFGQGANRLEEFRIGLQRSGIELEEVGAGIRDLGVAMTVGITVPLVALGNASLSAFMDFDLAFAGVRKTITATEEEFGVLYNSILDMSTKMPTAASEIAQVVETAGQLGVQKDAVLGFSEAMIHLGNTTNLSASEAAMSLAQFANITQMSHHDVDRLASTIFKLDTSLATTAKSITEMSLRLAAAGTQIGLSEAEIVSFAGAIASTGMEAQAGGTAFSKVFIEMQLAVERGGDALQNFAKVAGLTTLEFRKKFKEDAAGAVMAFVEGLGRMEERGQSAIGVLDSMGITEVRMRDALLRAANASDLFRDSLAKGTKEWEENNALTNAAAERYEAFSNKLETFKNLWQRISTLLGGSVALVFSDILKVVTPVVEVIGLLVEKFVALPEPIQKVVIVSAMLMATIGPFLTVLGTILTRLDGIGSSMMNVGKAFTGFTGVINSLNNPLTKILGIFLLVAAALTAILILVNALKGNANQVGQIADQIANTQQPLLNMQNKSRNIPSYAVGTNNHPGGRAIVGEKGPEIVDLPPGTKVHTTQESKQMVGGNTYNITIDSKNVKEFNRMIEMVENLTTTKRMGVPRNA